MKKFNVGDQVELISVIAGTGLQRYKNYTVSALSSHGEVFLKDENLWYSADHFKLAENPFKIGDWVECINDEKQYDTNGVIADTKYQIVSTVEEYGVYLDGIDGYKVSSRFKLVEPEVWTVENAAEGFLNDNQGLKSSLHTALQKAYDAGREDMRNEMKRLIDAH